jgi:hypothetical protein
MTKTTVIGSLVDNHSIFHVITSVGDNSHDSINSTRTLLEVVLTEGFSSHDRCLREQKSINFIIHSERMVVVRCSHGLLSHLALIHVSRTLVIVSKRYGGGNNGQHFSWV